MEAPPSDNVYVAELPPEIDDAIVNQLFSAYGTVVSCKAMPGKLPGQLGAALVRFGALEEAQWVVDNINGNIPQGLSDPIKVRFANQKKQEGSTYGKISPIPQAKAVSPYAPSSKGAQKGGKGGKGSCDVKTLLDGLNKAGVLPGGGRKPDINCLYITGLPWDTTDVDLYKMFSPFGGIAPKGVKAMTKDDGSCSGVGFVDFVEADHAALAIQTLNGTLMPGGAILQVKNKGPPKKGVATQDLAT